MFGVSAGPSIGNVSGLAPISASQRRQVVSGALLMADALSCMLVFLAASLMRGPGAPAQSHGVILLQTAVAVSIFAAAKLHSGGGRSGFERLRARTIASAAVSAAVFVLDAVSGNVDLTGAILLMPPLLLVTHYTELGVITWFDRRGMWAERALIVGDSQRLQQLIQELRARKVFAIRPVAVLDTGASNRDTGGAHVAGLPAVADARNLKQPIDIIIWAGQEGARRLDELTNTLDTDRVLLLADSDGGSNLWASTRAVGSVIGIERSRGAEMHEFVRRAVDLLVVGLLAIPANVLVGLAIFAVKYVDPGPAFFVQRRVGKDGREFNVLKIRSMYCDSDRRLAEHLAADARAKREWETGFKLKNDPRILPCVGHFIRRSSIDELPQLWNVLRGEMNLVGPRPFPEYHVKMFDEEFRALRTSVRPGLTGLWQVSTRSEGDLAAQKADDVFYIRNRSLWMDFYILLQTVPAVVSGSGAR